MFQSVDVPQLVLFVAASAIFTYFTVDRKALTLNAAATAVGLAFVVTYSIGAEWLIPLVVFFLSSSIIGRIFPSNSRVSDEKHGQPRDVRQVLANGSVYALAALMRPLLFQKTTGTHDLQDLILLFESSYPGPEVLLLSIMAVATADTWSSEIGQHFRHTTFDIIRWARISPGLSGGVSIVGTLAGLAGSFLIALLLLLLQPDFTTDLVYWIAVITFTGFAGMLLDSTLGSLIQAKYKDLETGDLLDAPIINSTLSTGAEWVTNDVINFLSILLTAVILYLLLMI